jgi:hypothetical protein
VVVSRYDVAERAWREPTATPLRTMPFDDEVSWSGTELLAHDRSTGADHSYHPDDGAWHELPPSPLGRREGDRYTWMGGRWWQAGGGPTSAGDMREQDGRVAAYDPAASRWERMTGTPQVMAPVVDLGNGTWLGPGWGEEGGPGAWVYDVATSRFDDAPTAPAAYEVVVSDGHAVAVGVGPGEDGTPALDARVLTPGWPWRNTAASSRILPASRRAGMVFRRSRRRSRQRFCVRPATEPPRRDPVAVESACRRP